MANYLLLRSITRLSKSQVNKSISEKGWKAQTFIQPNISEVKVLLKLIALDNIWKHEFELKCLSESKNFREKKERNLNENCFFCTYLNTKFLKCIDMREAHALTLIWDLRFAIELLNTRLYFLCATPKHELI